MKDTWQTAPDRLAISPRHVDVWLTSTELGEEQVRAYAGMLTRTELARAQKCKARARYREYVITRGLLRKTLYKAVGPDLAGVEFNYGEHGKPGLAGHAVAFSVAHSHGLALVALTPGGRLGVDLERLRPRAAWRRLAGRCFSEAERRALQAQTPADALPAFFACWTRKEAFVKALGDGIAHGLQAFDVSVDPRESHVRLNLRQAGEDAGAWLLRNVPAPTGYAAALALDRPAYDLRLWRAWQ